MAERVPLYLDFASGEIREINEDDSLTTFPINSVVMNTDDADPATYLGGAWSSLGSATIGVTTVYYYQRIAP